MGKSLRENLNSVLMTRVNKLRFVIPSPERWRHEDSQGLISQSPILSVLWTKKRPYLKQSKWGEVGEEAGKMAQHLGTSAALGEDLGFQPPDEDSQL